MSDAPSPTAGPPSTREPPYTPDPPGPISVLTEAIESVASGSDLTEEQATSALDEIMSGRANAAQTAGLLIGLRTKGETVGELVGLARAMRRHATPVVAGRGDLLDTAGTGGGAPSFNVSTTAALIAAGAGCAVAKHGNRSSTGPCGSADLLEALGARIDLPADAVARTIDEVGFGFMFAPAYHPAMRHVMPVRRALGVRTVFNALGPLTNPAGAPRQIIGVSEGALLEPIARALARLGAERALVVRGHEGLDEISATGPTAVWEVAGGEVRESEVTPEEFGVEPVTAAAFTAGSPERNAQITRGILGGDIGPERTLALVNAAAAIYACGRASDYRAAREQASGAIDSGAAMATLDRFVELSNQLGKS